MNHPSGESIWGNINTAIEIAMNIYLITAKDVSDAAQKIAAVAKG